MKKLRCTLKNWLVFFSLTAFAYNISAQPATTNDSKLSISMVAATSVGQSLPFGVFTGQGWQAESNAQYTKLHIHADDAFTLSKVDVQTCAPLTKAVNLYINFDESQFILKPIAGSNDLTYSGYFPSSIRSMTFNFNENTPVCISAIKLYNKEGQLYQVQTPKILDGKVTASSTLKPVLSYDVMSLFDSRYEYAWSSDGKSIGENLNFQFNQPTTVSKIKIWNGYQRSDIHCYSNGRVKSLKIEGDNGYSATVNVADVLGPQILNLEKPFVGQNLKITIADAFAGKKYPDLVISELRFFDGQSWFLINPLNAINNIANSNRTQFQQAGFAELLNRNLKAQTPTNQTKSNQRFSNWNLRFRTDGSFYLEGSSETKDLWQDFYGLGNYEIQSNTSGSMKVKVFGFLRKREESMGGDCNGCGRNCNNPNQGPDGSKLFIEYLQITKTSDRYTIENVSPNKQLPFTKLPLVIE